MQVTQLQLSINFSVVGGKVIGFGFEYANKFVVANTLDALKGLHYPREKLQVVVADDSSDETADVIDRKVTELNTIGIQSVVSRREGRAGFKSGALNQAAPLLKGDYVLLLDADSTVSPDVLIKGLNAIGRNPRIGFVSFRVGHYNREQNWTTRLFALHCVKNTWRNC